MRLIPPAVLVALLAAAPAQAATVEVDAATVLTVTHLEPGARTDASPAGDFNGDGLADLAIGSGADDGGRGEVLVVFGRRDRSARVDARRPGAAALRIVG